jgi:effector-binding domain-containing protein
VLVIERESSPQDLGKHLADILPKVHAYITAHGQQPSGRPFMRYLDMTDRFVIAAGFPIDTQLEGAGDIELRELPGGRALTAQFTGQPNMVGAAWTAVFAFAEAHGYERGSEWNGMGGWDVYVNDPEVVGAANAQTRLYLPLPD